MPAEPIQFYNRYTRQRETEQIYGESWLRFAYENPVGGAFVWLLAKRRFFSAYFGWRMSRRYSAAKVLPFVLDYNLDHTEFAKSALLYRSFNEFFYRALKPEARPIATGDQVAVLPADGRHLAFPDVDAAEGFYVKGAKFTLTELLGDAALAEKFAGGAMLISRLCPVDYHRFHFPAAGTPGEPRLINGWLYSVSPIALRRNIRYLAQNKRVLTLLETPAFGTVTILEVGATNVGSIKQSHVPGRAVTKGEEKGYFKFGGSCVITLFQRGRIRFEQDLVTQSAQCIETYAKMGDRLGEAV
ncbi:MAG TPA: archaetidylserine decarboxylase [Opitutaceae bacterium]|nr:archaetidylserine decarboxylase [Opitutaceae bacterium]HRJ48363.1 archaetidylserine decarboxylase [Opitutaceae bacterium]